VCGVMAVVLLLFGLFVTSVFSDGLYSVYYHPQTHNFTINKQSNDTRLVGTALFYNTVNVSGWATLEITTVESVDDVVQATAAGYVEVCSCGQTNGGLCCFVFLYFCVFLLLLLLPLS